MTMILRGTWATATDTEESLRFAAESPVMRFTPANDRLARGESL